MTQEIQPKNGKGGATGYKKAYFTGLIILLFVAVSARFLGYFEQLGRWMVPDVLIHYVPSTFFQTAILLLVGLCIPLVLGLLVQKLTRIPKVREWLLSESPPVSLFRRLAGNFFSGGVNYLDYLDKPEVVWEVARGVFKIGLLARKEGSYVLVMEPTVGVSPGNGFFWLIKEEAIRYTGRSGTDLWPDLIKMGLGENGNKPMQLPHE